MHTSHIYTDTTDATSLVHPSSRLSSSQAAFTVPHIHTLLSQYLYAIPLTLLFSCILYQRLFSPLARILGLFLASLTN
jgi:hypothetical protein